MTIFQTILCYNLTIRSIIDNHQISIIWNTSDFEMLLNFMKTLTLSIITFRINSNRIYVLIVEPHQILLGSQTVLSCTWSSASCSRSFSRCVISASTCYILLTILSGLLLNQHFLVWCCGIILVDINCVEIIAFRHSLDHIACISIDSMHLLRALWYRPSLNQYSTSLVLKIV